MNYIEHINQLLIGKIVFYTGLLLVALYLLYFGFYLLSVFKEDDNVIDKDL